MASASLPSSIKARSLDMARLKPVMQLGWIAKGVVYGLMGIIAIPIALGSGASSGEEASRSGALATIADNSFGSILLVLTAIGLVLYSLWRLTTAFLPGDNSEPKTWAHRIGWLFSAVVYGFLAYTAFDAVFGGGSTSDGGKSNVEKLTESLMGNTGGRWLLGIGAVVALGIAGYFAYKGIDRRYMDEIDTAGASGTERSILKNFGAAGWIGRSVTVGLSAVFVLIAAVTADPDEAKGLDAALRDVADNWWGTILVLIAGVGLLVYGIHAAVSARHRRLLGP